VRISRLFGHDMQETLRHLTLSSGPLRNNVGFDVSKERLVSHMAILGLELLVLRGSENLSSAS
jgi:hypothetical protein